MTKGRNLRYALSFSDLGLLLFPANLIEDHLRGGQVLGHFAEINRIGPEQTHFRNRCRQGHTGHGRVFIIACTEILLRLI